MARAAQQTAERRRRNTDALGGKRRKLAITGGLDTENFVYRWANDEGNRLHELTKMDDWDVVEDRTGTMKPDGTGVGAEVAVPVGTGDGGRQVRAVLLRKPKRYYEDDERQKSRRIDETEASLKAGNTPGAEADPNLYSKSTTIEHEGNS